MNHVVAKRSRRSGSGSGVQLAARQPARTARERSARCSGAAGRAALSDGRAATCAGALGKRALLAAQTWRAGGDCRTSIHQVSISSPTPATTMA